MPFFIRNVLLAAIAALSLLTFQTMASAETGGASWYALTSRTASGEMCDPGAMTAAHRSLPFGTKVRVENLKTGRSVIVRINDRGPFIGGRVIDLTRGAAKKLGIVNSGVAKVRLTVVGRA